MGVALGVAVAVAFMSIFGTKHKILFLRKTSICLYVFMFLGMLQYHLALILGALISNIAIIWRDSILGHLKLNLDAM